VKLQVVVVVVRFNVPLDNFSEATYTKFDKNCDYLSALQKYFPVTAIMEPQRTFMPSTRDASMHNHNGLYLKICTAVVIV